MTRAAATTRFLLGRRGRHLYPLRSPTGTATTASSIFETASKPTTGRHGVPPPKQGWNCKKQQQAYAYGFPIPQTPHKYHWVFSPVVMVTLLLLSACFLGAYCLVLRIDQSLQATLQPHGSSTSTSSSSASSATSSSAISTTSNHLRGSSSKVQQHLNKEEPLPVPSVPLYLNLTLFQIPCDGLSVSVVQSAHNAHNYNYNQSMDKSDRLIFKDIRIQDAQSNLQTQQSISRNLILTHPEKQHTTDNNKKLEFTELKQAPQVQVHMRRLEEEEEGNNSEEQRNSDDEEEELLQKRHKPGIRLDSREQGNDDAPHDEEDEETNDREEQVEEEEEEEATTGCQVLGHLQLPLGHHHPQPATVSIKTEDTHQHSNINLSHRIDLLKIGSTRSFPKEESLFLNRFRPHVYTQHDDQSLVVTHRYTVYDNFHLVEQKEPSPSPPTGDHAEIQLIFAPMSVQQTRER